MDRQVKNVLVFSTIGMCIYFAMTKNPSAPEQSTIDLSKPDLFLTHAKIDHFRAIDGTLDWTINSNKVTYNQTQDIFKAAKPIVIIAKNNRVPQTTLKADMTTFTRHSEVLKLRDNVSLEQKNNRTASLITTDKLNYYPSRHYAESLSPVAISSDVGKTEGDQLKIWLDREIIELSGNVRGTHDPQ